MCVDLRHRDGQQHSCDIRHIRPVVLGVTGLFFKTSLEEYRNLKESFPIYNSNHRLLYET